MKPNKVLQSRKQGKSFVSMMIDAIKAGRLSSERANKKRSAGSLEREANRTFRLMQRNKRKPGEPDLRKASDGTIYKVDAKGTWSRITPKFSKKDRRRAHKQALAQAEALGFEVPREVRYNKSAWMNYWSKMFNHLTDNTQPIPVAPTK